MAMDVPFAKITSVDDRETHLDIQVARSPLQSDDTRQCRADERTSSEN
jgi:hypothetical protein